MIKIWFLTVWMTGGFTAIPQDTEEACRTAAQHVPTGIAWDAQCHSVEMKLITTAPIYSPLPPKKP